MPRWDMQDLDDEEEDIFQKSIHDIYSLRPSEIEGMTLADFATIYQKSSKQAEEDAEKEDGHGLTNDEVEQNFQEIPKIIKIKTGSESFSFYNKQKFPAILDTFSFRKDKQPQKYYFSQLLLFSPWRDESSLEVEPEELYLKNKEYIEENAKRHLLYADDVNSAEEELHKEGLDDGYMDEIAPGMAADNAEADEEGQEQVTGMDADECNSGEKTDKCTVTSNTLNDLYKKEAEKHLLSNKEYNKCFRSLNKEEKEAVLFNHIWCKKCIVAKNNGECYPGYKLFVSGPGGTGKSHVIKMIHRDIQYFFKLEDNQIETDPYQSHMDPRVLLTAFTGTAAFNIDGLTLHTALQLPTNEKMFLSEEKLNILEQRLGNLKLLIIDEISLVSQEMLEKIHKRLCTAKQKDEDEEDTFGNVSVLAVGDFNQLKPVGGSALFSTKKVKTPSDLGSQLFDAFKVHKLHQNMRQAGDLEFGKILNSIRTKQPEEGSMEDKMLKSREIAPNSHNYPQDAIHAFAQNKYAFERNLSMLNKLAGVEINCVAKDSKKGFPDDPLKTGRLVKELKVKKGARVMLTNNLDISDGLTNGAMGTITHFIFGDNRKQPHTILIKFDNNKIGVTASKGSKYRHICTKSVPITPYEATFYLNAGKTDKGI